MADISTHHMARKEFDAALSRLESSSVARAQRLLAEYDRVVATIVATPDRYPWHDDNHRYAQLPGFPSYSVIYKVEDGVPRVIAFAHSSRAPDYWQGRI